MIEADYSIRSCIDSVRHLLFAEPEGVGGVAINMMSSAERAGWTPLEKQLVDGARAAGWTGTSLGNFIDRGTGGARIYFPDTTDAGEPTLSDQELRRLPYDPPQIFPEAVRDEAKALVEKINKAGDIVRGAVREAAAARARGDSDEEQVQTGAATEAAKLIKKARKDLIDLVKDAQPLSPDEAAATPRSFHVDPDVAMATTVVVGGGLLAATAVFGWPALAVSLLLL